MYTVISPCQGTKIKVTFALSLPQYAEDNQIPLVALIGESEVEAGVVKVRNTVSREEVTVKREELVEVLRQKLTGI